VESEYGSLIRGLIKLQKAARKEGKKETPGPGPGGLLTSFKGGMSVLTDTLAVELGSRVRLNSAVESIAPSGEQYVLHMANGASEEFDSVVLAAPAYAQSEILREMAPGIAADVEAIEYPSLAVVCMGYNKARAGNCLDGFGFLVPSREKRNILGTVADSNVFPDRAPEGHLLLRTMVGGARSSHLAELPEDQLTDMIRSELKGILGLTVDPDFVSIYRHARAIPQYLVGHADRLASIEAKLLKFPGLVMTGNAFRGVSLNDCVLNALKTAQSLVPSAVSRNRERP
jgi:oxygen-dependent protoporphyrinogen oxidase